MTKLDTKNPDVRKLMEENRKLKESLKLCMSCIKSLETHYLALGWSHGIEYGGPRIDNWDELAKEVGYRKNEIR